MTNVNAELKRIRGVWWADIPGELEKLVRVLEVERDSRTK